VKHFVGNDAGNSQTNNKLKLIMSTIKTKPAPNGAASASASPDQAAYRINPEVEAKIDAHIKENPKHWTYLQSMPRDRLERTVVLNEVRQLERQQRMRDGMMKKINASPELKQAYDILVKNVPEDQREEVMSQIARQTQRAVSRSQTQQQTKGQAVGV
jgi:thioester reductase-like protein